MTQAELDALPEDGTFSCTEVIRDGKRVQIPKLVTVGVLYHKPDEPISVVDAYGQGWMIGWANGVRYKRRMQS